MSNNLELACGLIGIGRTWGFKPSPIPSDQAAATFLESAFSQGISYYDTAPSYGLSEARLGDWLRTLNQGQRSNITIATKFGEHWRAEDQQSYVDHTYDALRSSLDQSLTRLGQIDVLQLHKTTPAVLLSDGLKRAWSYARAQGITRFGASVSDIESGEMVCGDDAYEVVQLPFNQKNAAFLPIIRLALERGKTVVINRPFNMGELIDNDSQKSRAELEREAFRFIFDNCPRGLVLTGTKSPEHLEDNLRAFEAAQLT